MEKLSFLFFKKTLTRMAVLALASFSFISFATSSDTENEYFGDLRSEIVGLDSMVTGAIDGEKMHMNYCANILDDAKETRNAILTERLTSLEGEVDQKLDVMAKRIDILKSWTKKREDFLAKANDSLVQIFQSMRPDSAALQLTEIGPAMSAAIISKLEPKYSSAILAEMKPADAAKITMVLTNVMVTDASN